jgi:hypothetical protein
MVACCAQQYQRFVGRVLGKTGKVQGLESLLVGKEDYFLEVLVVLDGAEPGAIPISCAALELSCVDYVLARVHGDESRFLARLLGAIDGTVEGSVGYAGHCR